MVLEGLKRAMMGIAYGGIFTFIILTVIHFTEIETTISQIWISMLCSFILGIYFGISSLIFEEDRWSILKQTVIHFILSISFYMIIALFAGWIPLTIIAILLASLFFAIFYMIYWVSYYFYYKKVEKSLNDSISKKD